MSEKELINLSGTSDKDINTPLKIFFPGCENKITKAMPPAPKAKAQGGKGLAKMSFPAMKKTHHIINIHPRWARATNEFKKRKNAIP